MKRHKKIILSLSIVAILVFSFSFGQTARAADTSIYISPAEASKKAGDIFDISVMVDLSGKNICAAEGKINLSGLSCQKITIGSGISSQTSPSCDNLNFLLGIQGCTSAKKELFVIRVKMGSKSPATAKITNIDIIGEGVPLSYIAHDGRYTIALAPACDCGVWTSWESADCGSGKCIANQIDRSRTRDCDPSGCDDEKQSICVYNSNCVTSQAVQEDEQGEVLKSEVVDDLVVKETIEVAEGKEDNTTRDDVSDIISDEISGDSFLASAAAGIAQSVPLTAMAILCLVGLAGVGAKEYWLFKKKRKK